MMAEGIEGVEDVDAGVEVDADAGAVVVDDADVDVGAGRLAGIAQNHKHQTAHCGLDTPFHSLLFTRSHGGSLSYEARMSSFFP